MALNNQSTNWADLERGEHALLKSAIRIGDIPVERNSAIEWKNRGVISKEAFESGHQTVGDIPI